MKHDSIKLQQAIALVVRKAQFDRDFRLLAMTKAHEAIARVSGLAVAPSAAIFVEQGSKVTAKDGGLLVELPPLDDDCAEVELSEDEMEQVSGGGDGDGTGVTWKP